MTRLLEECGELHRSSITLRGRASNGKSTANRIHKLAKEVMDVLGCALQIALHNDIADGVEALLETGISD
jgi:NTP pyrophosphatase (non-canonical NTP hydrolase)